MRVPEPVDAGLDRDGPGRGAVRCGIWHVPRLVAAGRAPWKAGVGQGRCAGFRFTASIGRRSAGGDGRPTAL
ncbi:hypothetical protein I545_1578 [Mycobacterium kansasii 662]|uniref:Uncharacterized protein n=1 Tax=Mycobacterium kansasii 662 TaxID=1299326 RepID=X7ZPF8_MYCKA|nr:hypothetical protein I545_1578 [Mycobacterium kansasii 662]KEP42407.1 hypothetical protein MKSMC1_24490 [Mycobacterium kansasii]